MPLPSIGENSVNPGEVRAGSNARRPVPLRRMGFWSIPPTRSELGIECVPSTCKTGWIALPAAAEPMHTPANWRLEIFALGPFTMPASFQWHNCRRVSRSQVVRKAYACLGGRWWLSGRLSTLSLGFWSGDGLLATESTSFWADGRLFGSYRSTVSPRPFVIVLEMPVHRRVMNWRTLPRG